MKDLVNNKPPRRGTKPVDALVEIGSTALSAAMRDQSTPNLVASLSVICAITALIITCNGTASS